MLGLESQLYFQKQYIEEHLCQHVLMNGSQPDNRKWRVLWSEITWSVWNWRNHIIFRNMVFNMDKMMQDVLFQSWSWLKTFEPDFSYSFMQWESNTTPCFDYLCCWCCMLGASISLVKRSKTTLAYCVVTRGRFTLIVQETNSGLLLLYNFGRAGLFTWYLCLFNAYCIY